MNADGFGKHLGMVLGVILAFNVGAAGLNISNIPLYVTQPLEPNVIISPVYGTEFNEASMRKAPWDTVAQDFINSCNANYVDGCQVGRSGFWIFGAPFYANYSGSWGWRVTPWPGTYKVNPALADSPVTSDVALYPHDNVVVDGVIHFKPLDYVPGHSIATDNLPTDELSPAAAAAIPIARARARYERSDLNFLYFNKRVADNPNHGYSPWPDMGGYTFPTYQTAAQAATPYYHPIMRHDLTANLAVTATHAARHCDSADLDYSCVSAKTYDVPHYIGQYWTYDGMGKVWQEGSFTQTTWAEMSESDKIKFAHWFTYWRSADLSSRGMLAKLVDSLSSRNKDLLMKMRVGIFHAQRDGTGAVIKRVGVVSNENESDRISLLADIIYNQSNVYTTVTDESDDYRRPTGTIWDPWLTIGYFKEEAPYRENPSLAANAQTNPVRSCRRNYEIVVTPDYTGLRRDVPGQAPRTNATYSGNYDGDLGVPYADAYSTTYGDVGAYGWNTDLMPDLENNLLAGKIDEQKAQHLVRYVIGPSDFGNIFNRPIVSYDDALNHLATEGVSTWYDHSDYEHDQRPWSFGRSIIDELWHLALNSRGFFYGGENVSDALDKLLQSLNDILVSKVSGSSIATSTTSLSTNDLIYQASVESDWKGHLRAYRVAKEVNADGKDVLNVDFKTPAWNLAENVSAQLWSARNISTYSGSSGVAFRWANVSDGIKTYLKSEAPDGIVNLDTYGTKVLEYLRGSGECEDGSGTTCSSGTAYTFRRRNIERNNNISYSSSNLNGRNVLGDIANSNPWLIAAPVAGPSDVDYPGYNAFRVSNKDRQSVLYVGANDGMLHAVNASNGAELFSYIPGFVQSKLYQLAKPSYGHNYYADGSPFSANVKVGNDWKTLLAGGANKGGKGYYLLDVTNPTTNTEENASTWVKWEFTHPDLHYSYNLPVTDRFGQARQFIRTNDNGKWALVVGNGYPEAANKQACLFIIYVSGPSGDGNAWVQDTDYRKLCAGVTDYSVTGSNDGGLGTNGLSTPTPYDTNGDGKVDVVYAGDLNGNLWRFDVGSTTPGEWAVAYSGNPVFVAKNAANVRQPIISPPEVTTLVAGSTVGQLVLLGTGKYLETSDLTNASTQSFYGVWDRGLSGLTRSNLVAQVLDTPETIDSVVVRQQTTKSHPAYCSTGVDLAACVAAGKNLGWYWDMPTSGERLTGRLSLINGVVFFNTFYPTIEAYVEDGVTKYRLDPCGYGGDGWLMGLNAVNGYMEDRFSVFDVNRDGVVDESSDAKVAGVRVGLSMGGTTFAKGLKDTMVGLYSPSNKEQTDKNNKAIVKIDPASSGRVSWFELLD